MDGSLSNSGHLTHFIAIFEGAHMITGVFPSMRNIASRMAMESGVSGDQDKAEGFVNIKSCEYKALKECLDRNGGKKEKCEKEWRNFQQLCSNNKK